MILGDLSAVSDRDIDLMNQSGRGDEFAQGSSGGGDARDQPSPTKVRDICVPDLHIDTLEFRSSDF